LAPWSLLVVLRRAASSAGIPGEEIGYFPIFQTVCAGRGLCSSFKH
jgi:hypothetical protein